jgi:hypothetical protein
MLFAVATGLVFLAGILLWWVIAFLCANSPNNRLVLARTLECGGLPPLCIAAGWLLKKKCCS